MKKILGVSLTFICLLLAAVNSYALIHFDFEQKFFTELGKIVKDHSLIRVGSTYHLFYLRGDPAVNIGHATSTDLIHWMIEEPLLLTTPGGWDELALWAPHVIFNDGIHFMFFTGVNHYWAQQTGLAVSSNVEIWTKLSWPVYTPDSTWAQWSYTAWSHGRDPFVFSYNGKHYMLVTAKTYTNQGAIASAVSNDLISWQDNGPLYIHNSWHVLESVQLIQYNNKFHLFFTEEVINGTSHMTSDSLYSGWDISTRIKIDDGHAAEINEFDGNYIFSRHAIYNDYQGTYQYYLVFDTLKWAGDNPYIHRPWALGNDWQLIWGSAFVFQPTFGRNPYARGDTVDVNYEGNCWIGTYERYPGPLVYGSPGTFQGDGTKGLIRSRTFTITGNSINLLVSGGNYPNECYVALVDASTGAFLFKETGKNTDHMDRRYWDVSTLKGNPVYLEIADLSSASFGHINCDDINESYEVIGNPNQGNDPPDSKNKPQAKDPFVFERTVNPFPALYQNIPNPFNPNTSITYFLPHESRVNLEVFNVDGRRVAVLAKGLKASGKHVAGWNGRDSYGKAASSGIYFYRLMVNGQVTETRKMILLR